MTLKSASGSRLISVAVEKQLAAAGNYGANDVLSESASAGTSWVFTDSAHIAGGAAKIIRALLSTEVATQTFGARLYLYTIAPTCNLNDNVANDGPNVADKEEFIGVITFGNQAIGLGGGTLPFSEAILAQPLPFICATADKDIYGVLVTEDAFTDESATQKVVVKLWMEQDNTGY